MARRVRRGQTWDVNDSSTPKAEWVDRLPAGPPLRDELARLVDSDGARDSAENELFEIANDPQFMATEAAQRRLKSQLRRRLRHRASNERSHLPE